MSDSIQTNIKGIKCDNRNCDYVDMNIPYEEYENWLNKPCPKCSQNLLTTEDYEICKMLMNAARIVNKFSSSDNTDEVKVKLNMEFDDFKGLINNSK